MDVKPKFTIERLLQMDLNNPKEVSIQDIFESIKCYDTERFNTFCLDEDSPITKELFVKMNEDRKIILRKHFSKYIYINKNARDVVTYEDKSEIEFSKLEINIKAELDELSYNSVTTYLIDDLSTMYKMLFYDSIVMKLPFKDDNITSLRKQIQKDIDKISVTLRRMGELSLVNHLQEVKLNNIYTFTSYYKEWEAKSIEELKQKNNMGLSTSKKILAFIKNIVKEELISSSELSENISKNTMILKKLLPESISMLRQTAYQKYILKS